MRELITKSDSQTKKVAREISLKLTPPEVLALYGNLGSGKTTFIQGLAEGLGINKRVLSPTFVFSREYKIKGGKFYHFDLYRIDSERDIEAIGLKDFLTEDGAIIAIEWPEKIEHILPANTVRIRFESLGENVRKIMIQKP